MVKCSGDTSRPKITIFTDGAANPNPGPGGYGIVLIYATHRKELSAGYQMTTNNRMELMAAKVGLESLERECAVTLYSDSRYLVDGMSKGWAEKWRSNGWMRNKEDEALNSDLWEALLEQGKRHNVEYKWVRGHSGHPENERCDQLATAAIRSSRLLEDTEYGAIAQNHVSAKQATSRKVGERCRECGIALVKKIPRRKKFKPHQTYYYEYYLYCPNCGAIHMAESAKRFIR